MERQVRADAGVLQGVSYVCALGQRSMSANSNYMDVLSGCVLKVTAPL